MTDYVNGKLRDYKIKRYLLFPGGALLWIKDQILNLPEDVNVFYADGRKLFTRLMDTLIVQIANLVEQRLQQAKAEVAKGQARIKSYVAGLPKDLKAVGEAAAKEVSGRFEELEKSIDDKKNDLAQKLAEKYKEAHDKADESLKKIQEENKGLASGFLDSLAEVIKALKEFKARIMGLIKKGEETIKLILNDPIQFLANLINAIKLGLNQFVNNIWTHLKAGFMKWLFGSLAEMGIELPTDLSLPSILKLVLGVLGITYARMRAKAVKLIGERAVSMIEKLVELVKALIDGGPAAMWEKLKEYLSDLKAQVIDAIQDWIVTTVVKAAITKLVSMFNPAGAIVQAIMAIYNTVMFLIERASQIMAMVEAVINSVYNIATGAISGAANWIEQALARTIPLVISFLARLIGLGGISQKIKEIIQKVQGAVDKAIDKVIGKIVGFIKKLFGADKGKEESPELQAGLKDLDAITAKSEKEAMTKEELSTAVAGVKTKHKVFKSLSVNEDAEDFVYDYSASPGKKKKGPHRQVNYAIGEHPASRPKGFTGGGGDSHHVPVKVLVKWFGEVLKVAGTVTRDSGLKSKGEEYRGNAGGGLSAIWLSEKSHVAAHEPAEPGEMKTLRSEIQVLTSEGDLSSKPMRSTITSTVYEKTVGKPVDPEQDQKSRIREIYDKKAPRIGSLFKKVFDGLLEQGVAMVDRPSVNLSDKKWIAKLRKLAKETWASFLKVPKVK